MSVQPPGQEPDSSPDVAHLYDLEGDLRGRELRNADLRGVDLRGRDLQGADLSGADLRGADLRDAGLIKVSLARANLSGARLSGADLSEADLNSADLEAAVLGHEIVPLFLHGCARDSTKQRVDAEEVPRMLCQRCTHAGSFPRMPRSWWRHPSSPESRVEERARTPSQFPGSAGAPRGSRRSEDRCRTPRARRRTGVQ